MVANKTTIDNYNIWLIKDYMLKDFNHFGIILFSSVLVGYRVYEVYTNIMNVVFFFTLHLSDRWSL